MQTQRRFTSAFMSVLAVVALCGFGSALADPPGRVVRLSYLSGQVSFTPSGEEQWSEATINRPLITGDKLYTDRDSRVELEVGAASARLDDRSGFTLLNLDDQVAQMQLTEGTLSLRVRRVFEGQTYEIDTPTLAFVINQPGEYRVDIAPQGDSTMITVRDGGGDVYGEGGASYQVRPGESYRFYDSQLRDYEVLALPRGDDFDRWVASRDDRSEHSRSREYVSEETIGYEDLDEYGQWDDVPEYGHVWYPTTVETGWAPYRQGHWNWIDPWGWSWVDSSPWGFAPFHYGRWAYVSDRWGWVPGPVSVRPVYAPALVAFVGGGGWGGASITVGGGGPVGWFPLGPRDVYVPWYRGSREYFTNINVRNTTVINNVNITNVYNNYSAGRPIQGANYAYRSNMAAVTAVPRDVFVGSRPVAAARVNVNREAFARADVVSRVGVTPVAASLVAQRGGNVRAAPPAAAFNRNVIARTAPPARAPSFAARRVEIERNGGQPLAQDQLQRLSTARTAQGSTAANNARNDRIRVVGQANTARPQPLPATAPSGRVPGQALQGSVTDRTGNGNGERVTNPTDRLGHPGNPAGTPPNGRMPIRSNTNGPASNTTGAPSVPTNPNALPSSNFVPRERRVGPAGNAPVNTANPNTPNATVNSGTPQRIERGGRDRTGPVNGGPVNAGPANNGRTNVEQRTISAPPRQTLDRVDRAPRTDQPVERSQPQRVERSLPAVQNNQQPTRVERTERSFQPQQQQQQQRVERSYQRPVQQQQPRVERSFQPPPQQPVQQAQPRIERAQVQPRGAPPPPPPPKAEARQPKPERGDKDKKDDHR